MALRPVLRTRVRPSSANAKNGASSSPSPSSNQETLLNLPVSISPDGGRLALATGKRSIACYRLSSLSVSSPAPSNNALVFTIEFDEMEITGVTPSVEVAITTLQWVGNGLLGVGFSTGLFRLIDGQGTELAAVRFQASPLLHIRLFPSQPLSQYEADTWLLHQDRIAVVVPIYCLAAAGQEAEPITYTRYHFRKTDEVMDLVIFSRQPRLFETAGSSGLNPANNPLGGGGGGEEGGNSTTPNNQTTSNNSGGSVNSRGDQCFLLTCGTNPTLGFYTLGGNVGYYRGLAELVTAVRKKLIRAMVGTVGTLLPTFGGYLTWGRGGSSNKDHPIDPFTPSNAAAARSGGAAAATTSSSDEGPPAVKLDRDMGFRDERRRALSAVMDPSERLVAITDSLGRVMVIDVWTRQVLRLFKGHRGAQVGWMEVPEAWAGQDEGSPMPNDAIAAQAMMDPARGEAFLSAAALGLYLVIYSPNRSQLEVWRMRHGPCVKTLSAPAGLQLVTSYGSNRSTTGPHFRLTRSFLVRQKADGTITASVIEIGEAETDGTITASVIEIGGEEVAELVRVRARSLDKEDTYHLRRVRILLGNLLERHQQLSTAEEGGEGVRDEGGSKGELEGQLLDLVHRIRSPYCLYQVVSLLDDEDSGAALLGLDTHRQATLLALDACSNNNGINEVEKGAAPSSTRRRYEAMTQWLRTRDRLVRAYQLMIDLKPDVLDEIVPPPSSSSSGSSPTKKKGGARPSIEAADNEDLAWATLAQPSHQQEAAAIQAIYLDYQHPLSVPRFLQACRRSPSPFPAPSTSLSISPTTTTRRRGPAATASSQAAPRLPPAILGLVQEKEEEAKTDEGEAKKEALRQLKQEALHFIMRPLLADVFAIKALDEGIQCLGWGPTEAISALGQWFLSLPPTLAARLVAQSYLPTSTSSSSSSMKLTKGGGSSTSRNKGVVGKGQQQQAGSSSSPLARWLGEVIMKAREAEGAEGQAGSERSLDPLYALCQSTTRLEQAISLAGLCGSLVISVAQVAEARSLGQLSSSGAGMRWIRLRRQLRVCLLVANRIGLEGSAREPPVALDTGASSLFGLLASDELTLTTSAEECLRLEKACSLAQHRRIAALTNENASSLPTDGIEAWGQIADERWPELIDAVTPTKATGSRPPLLLYFSWHNQPTYLACHRARCLTALWAVGASSPSSPPSTSSLPTSTSSPPLPGSTTPPSSSSSDANNKNSISSTPATVNKLVLAKDHLHVVASEDPRLAAAVSLDLWHRFIGAWLAPYTTLGPPSSLEGRGGTTKAKAKNAATTKASVPSPPFLLSACTRPMAESLLSAAQGFLLYIIRGLDKSARPNTPTVSSSTSPPPPDADATSPSSQQQYASSLAAQGLPPPQGEVWPCTTDRYCFETTSHVLDSSPTRWALQQHVALLQVITLMASANTWDVLPQALFPPHRLWCVEEALYIKAPSPPSPTTSNKKKAVEGGEEEEEERRKQARRNLIIKGLEVLGKEASQVVYVAGEALEVPLDWIRREHVLCLLNQGEDVLAEDLMVQVEEASALADPVLQLLRLRLAIFLLGLRKAGPPSAQVLATLDADTSQWVLSADEGEGGGGVAEGGGSQAPGGGARKTSLAGTHNVLLKLLGVVPPNSSHYRRAKALSTLCTTLLKALQQH